jgi:glycerol-3-phosphate acyltransferase PlsY
MMRTVWVVAAFGLGSVPFAVLLGHLAGVDPRRVGDGNPGAFNAWKAGGWKLGAPVLAADVLKGALPVACARRVGWRGGWLVAISLAPVMGHGFSPFLGGRGGKGLASTLGVWAGVTGPEAPLVLGFGLTLGRLGLRLRDLEAVAFGQGLLLAALLVRKHPPELLLTWLGLTGLLLWKYRDARA